MTRPVRLALVLLGLLAGCQAPSGARLPTAPFEFRATPAALAEGEALSLRLLPRGGGPVQDVGPVDVYLSFERNWGQALAYLSPSGAWTGTPTPCMRVAGGAPVPLVMRIGSVGPFGQYTFAVQFVRAGGSPSRGNYVFTPLVARVAVRPVAREQDGLVFFLGSLGVVSAGVVALVLVLSRRPAPAARPESPVE